jgi:hypothetical protein
MFPGRPMLAERVPHVRIANVGRGAALSVQPALEFHFVEGTTTPLGTIVIEVILPGDVVSTPTAFPAGFQLPPASQGKIVIVGGSFHDADGRATSCAPRAAKARPDGSQGARVRRPNGQLPPRDAPPEQKPRLLALALDRLRCNPLESYAVWATCCSPP